MDLTGRVAVVTGSAVGIGRGLCVAFAQAGADVVAIDVDAAENEATAAAVREAGGREPLVITCDIGDRGAVRVAADQVLRRFGRVDVLVNNAAVWNDTRLTAGDFDTQVAAFHRALGGCVVGAYHVTAALLPGLSAAGGGDVVNLLTDHVLDGHHITGAPATGYDVAKFGLWRLTESWAVELEPLGVRVNGLSFGATDTPMLRGVSAELADKGMKPADLAQAVFNVLAHGPGGPTGQNYVFGMTRATREEHLAGIAAIAPPA
jgi:NAD(P)-dependent dehydrogenase (short-subunit alcohol dehydrogenase family)